MRNDSYFQGNPVDLNGLSRTLFNMPHKWTGTLNTGDLVPFFSYGDVLPGDTWNVDTAFVLRSTTPVAPVMDDAYIDVFYFFTPHKLVLSRAYMSPSTNDANHSFAAFLGAQDSLLNMPLPEGVVLPHFTVANSGDDSPLDGFLADYGHSLADYLGLPFNGVMENYHQSYQISCLEPLAFYAVYNEFFRDPNVENPYVFSINDGEVILSKDGISIDLAERSSLPQVSVFHGYFGSALPWPQRGTSVLLPLGDLAPVVAKNESVFDVTSFVDQSSAVDAPVKAGKITTFTWSGHNEGGFQARGSFYADLSDATAASINNLRLAFQLQRFREKMARGGNRIQELTRTMFGVTPHDYTDDRPEYLGGARVRIGMTQVNNTAGTTESTSSQQSIGSTGAFSLTQDSRHYFIKSFDTWGTITGVCCIRVDESFSQGLPRRYSRKSFEDFYWPTFAFLGEQPILNKELYLLGSSEEDADNSEDEEVFGYQEAWAEYRYIPDVVCGFARPGLGYDYWHYSNLFSKAPLLKAFLNAGRLVDNVDRTLQVPSTTSGFQWLGQFLITAKVSRVMPLYSVPGLIDHF